MKTSSKGIGVLLFLAVAIASVQASEMVSLDIGGQVVRGELLRANRTELVLKVNGKEQVVPVLLLAPEAYLACARKLLDPKDSKGHWELSQWCKEKGLGQAGEELLAIAVALDPAFAEAHPSRQPDAV